MKVLLILNPGSRAGKGQELWDFWLQGLKDAQIEVEPVITQSLDHAFRLAKDASLFDAVIAAGGDGTINQVLDGVMHSQVAHLKLGVLYSGTSPDFCTFHGIPTNPQAAIQAIAQQKSRRVDVGQIVFQSDKGEERTAHFGCSSNIGMGAMVARRANRWRKYLGDTMGTGAAAMSAIAENPRVDLDLKIDGKLFHLSDVNNLFVLKNPFIASGIKLNFPLKPSDGHLVVAAIHGKKRYGLLKIFPKLYAGDGINVPGLFTKTCSSVEVRSSGYQEVEFDGDPRGWLPIKIKVLPSSIDLIGGRSE